MKTLTKLLSLFTLLVFFTNCSKDCKPETFNNNVDESYLPDIMPYSDTSTRLFLKNGTDTLLFKNLGLNRQIIQERANIEVCDIYNLQHLTLRMAASDTDFFDINYYSRKHESGIVKISAKNYWATQELTNNSFRFFPYPLIDLNVLGNVYDSVLVFRQNGIDSVCIKPKFGYLKIKTPKVTYELIK